MSFLDRVISIVILYIFAPFSVASSVIDDGSHFKLWRDQILVKFFSSYGMIIALNIFIILSTLVINPDVQFFDNSFLNFCMKVLVIVGSALGLNRSMALVGNLISSGAGSNELRDASQMGAGFMKTMGKPFSPLTAIAGEALNQKKRDLAGRALSKIGLGIKDNGQRNENGEKDKKSDPEENKNTNSPNYNNNKKGVSMAIANDFGTDDSNDNNDDKKDDDNQNDKKSNNTGQNLVNQAILNSNEGGGNN